MDTVKVRLVSVQVGRVVEYPPVEPGGSPWSSGIVKQAPDGPVFLGKDGLAGDEQSDHKHHGGPDRAVNVYPAEHYDFWRAVPGLEGMTGGAFGENFTTLGLLEHTACIGDTFRVGEAVVQITQPRGPCYKLNRRWGNPDLQHISEETHRYGWYLRVLQEGLVQGGSEMELLERPYPALTVRRAWELRLDPADREAVQVMAECPLLSQNWSAGLRKAAGLAK